MRCALMHRQGTALHEASKDAAKPSKFVRNRVINLEPGVWVHLKDMVATTI
jgi:hypothetical protein